jgi:GT2 family glycosyltransferase
MSTEAMQPAGLGAWASDRGAVRVPEPTELANCLDGPKPVAIRSLDLDGDERVIHLGKARDGQDYARLIALARDDGAPLGWVSLPALDGVVDVEQVVGRLREQTQVKYPAHDEELAGTERGSGRDESLLTVVIATCGDVEASVRCVAGILGSEDAGETEVIVVENRPRGSTVAEALVDAFPGREDVRCVEEGRSGLANARNAGLRAARGELIAFTDDDVVVDRRWVAALREAFGAKGVDCVTGLIAPLELENEAQMAHERFASYAKGFDERVYGITEPSPGEPLFPYAAGHFASGANMAFRTRALRGLGGFDGDLGTGTPARGCEDLDVCIRLLLGGHRLAYVPGAIVWHRHPETEGGFRRRVFDYGAALGALLTKHLVFGTDRRGMLTRAATAVRYFFGRDSRKNASRGQSFGIHLKALELCGLVYGPVGYLRSRLVRR